MISFTMPIGLAFIKLFANTGTSLDGGNHGNTATVHHQAPIPLISQWKLNYRTKLTKRERGGLAASSKQTMCHRAHREPIQQLWTDLFE